MTYQVLAIKYRPRSFDDVVAQDHITTTLRSMLERDRIGTGFLFCGPRGTGKTTCARILAMGINCTNGPNPNPDPSDPICAEIIAGSSLDVLEIDAASNTGVDDIRQLRENVRYLPTKGRKKIYIIDEVHRLSASAFDALLKTLEEPPAHVVFIFATTDPLKVPETILSRTHRFDFRRVSIDDLARHLRTITDRENVTISDAALRLIARKGDGSVRDSISLLDQIIGYAGDEVTENDVITSLGLVDRALIFALVDAAIQSDRIAALRAMHSVTESAVEGKDFLLELLEHLRLLMLLHTDTDNDLLALSESERADYQKQRDGLPLGDILRMIDLVTRTIGDIKAGLDARLMLDLLAVRMAEMDRTVDLAAALAELSGAGGKETGRSAAFFPGAKVTEKPNP